MYIFSFSGDNKTSGCGERNPTGVNRSGDLGKYGVASVAGINRQQEYDDFTRRRLRQSVSENRSTFTVIGLNFIKL